jgi:glycosyltransferase involved in cell wall biosynthesis
MHSKIEKCTVHIWAPDTGYVGGLQRHINFICLAAEELLSGSRVRIIQKTGKTGGLFALKALWFSLIERPQLIVVGHIHFTPIACLIKRLANIPFWVVSYGIESWSRRADSLKKPLLAAERILAMSNFTKEKIAAEFSVLAEKISVLPGTFDSGLFRIKPKPECLLRKYGLKEKQLVILTVCRMDKAERYKGYDKVIESMPRLIQNFPDMRYILIGYGSDTERIKGLIGKLKLGKHIIMPGKITGDELCDHYNLCDCFAMPSKQEGFGIVFLEALACGKPVLAGNEDGSVEALRNGELGVLVNPDNMDEISQNLARILKREHPNKVIYNPRLLREKAVEYFGFEKFKSTLKKYLESLTTCHSRGSGNPDQE